MAVIGANYLTLADWAKLVEDDGRMSVIVDLLSQTNEMMEDMLWVEGNLTDGYKTTVRTGLPQGTWRALYQGVTPTKSTTAQITERTGNLEAYSVLDKDLADLNGNTSQFRLGEDAAFFEGMTQQMQAALLYSNAYLTPAQIMGLSPRYNTINTANAETAKNVIDMGGTTSTCTSVWMMQWGQNANFGVFPRGKVGGLMHEDLGVWTETSAAGAKYQVYQSHFKWECGMCVRDWRTAVRMANIDVALLSGVNAANIINGLIRATHLFPATPRGVANVQAATRPSGIVGEGRFAIYCNRTVATFLDLQALNKTNVLLTMDQWDGRPVTMFRGIPIRTVDQLLSTETALT
jgi:hypothetical protein